MYDNHTKAKWRGWAWDQIRKRLSPGSRGSRVLVLAGDIAGDIPHSRRQKMECIGIDCKKASAIKFRKSGGVAINDSLHNQVLAIRPDAVIADMMHGLEGSKIGVFSDAVGLCNALVVNLLRGRDKGIREFGGVVPHYTGRRYIDEPVGKHRGKMLAICLGKLAAERWCGLGQENQLVPAHVMHSMRPSFYTYRSEDSGQYFDSMAISTSDFRVPENVGEILRPHIPVDSRRKAAAAKALLTMIKNKPKKGYVSNR